MRTVYIITCSLGIGSFLICAVFYREGWRPTTILFMSLGAACAIGSGWLIARPFARETSRLRQLRDSRLAGRVPVPFEQVYSAHYANSSLSYDLVHALWLEIATYLDIDPSRLRPDDQFQHDLMIASTTRGDELDRLTARRLASLGGSEPKIARVDDYIRILGPALSAPDARKAGLLPAEMYK